MGLVAIVLDLTFQNVSSPRWVRDATLVITLAVALGSLWPTLRGIRVRQTNIDLIADRLNRVSKPGDLIVVDPWYLGISFERYYHSSATWTTLPSISDHKLHRYDLIKSAMTLPDQDQVVALLRDQIQTTLKSGHQVWLVGTWVPPKPGFVVPTLPPAPNDTAQPWYCDPYYRMWSAKLGYYLGVCAANTEAAALAATGPVNSVEDFQLTRFYGN
jgi:hypothetical protein